MHYLEHLVEKEEKGTITEAESRLLESFFSDEYQHAEWDGEQMGKKAAVSAQIYTQIKKQAHFAKSWTSYIKYAAAALVALTVGAGILLNAKINPKAITLTTAGNIDSVKLVDGSTVYLAAHSSFQYPQHFAHNVRAVTLLKGNAFFKVAKDHKHPFIISSGAITTKVLGTSFHIGLGADKTSVTVVTGRVKVASGKQVAFLKPNESAVFTPATGLSKAQVSHAFMYNWYQKDLELNNVSLEQVFTLLNYNYGIDFKASDQAIRDTRITLYLNTALPVQNILDQIKYITHLKLVQHGNIITVSK
ncbi:fec operon regulator FecR [compost metagenome]